jgi:hypothetical protein
MCSAAIRPAATMWFVFTIRAIKKPEMVFLYVLKFEEIANLLFF